MKYKLTTITKIHNGKKLYRIKALKDFADVKKDTLGGYIQSEKNLSQKGNCWVYSEGVIKDFAWVFGNACIDDNSEVSGHSRVFGDTCIGDYAVINGHTYIGGNVNIGGDTRIGGNVCVTGSAQIFGDTNINGNICISATNDDRDTGIDNVRTGGDNWIACDTQIDHWIDKLGNKRRNVK